MKFKKLDEYVTEHQTKEAEKKARMEKNAARCKELFQEARALGLIKRGAEIAKELGLK